MLLGFLILLVNYSQQADAFPKVGAHVELVAE